jgi:hypothetical protein
VSTWVVTSTGRVVTSTTGVVVSDFGHCRCSCLGGLYTGSLLGRSSYGLALGLVVEPSDKEFEGVGTEGPAEALGATPFVGGLDL